MKAGTLWISLCLAIVFSAQAQNLWNKYPANPVLTSGPAGWDVIALGQPTVLFENDTIKMWYAGVGFDLKARICYAWSLDGIQWTKINNVLDVGAPGSWDDGWLDTPEVVRGPSGYVMLYYGDTAQQSPAISSAFGLATSPDGISWTRYPGNPVFDKGPAGSWEDAWVESPALCYDTASAQYLMWYTGVATNWIIQTGLASSLDCISWTRYPGNPVIHNGLPGSFDDMWVAVPAVIRKNNEYQLWYSAFSSVSGFDTVRIGYATSPDGLNWQKFPGNPVLSTFSPPYNPGVDTTGPWAPDVIFNDNTNQYMMWYEAAHGICLATAVNTSGIPEKPVGANNDMVIRPNPCIDHVLIQLRNASGKDGVLMLTNLTGSVIEKYSIDPGPVAEYTINIDLSIYKSGLYFICFTEGERQLRKKIILLP